MAAKPTAWSFSHSKEYLTIYGIMKLAECDATTALKRASTIANVGVAESARAALKEMADLDLREPTNFTHAIIIPHIHDIKKPVDASRTYDFSLKD